MRMTRHPSLPARSWGLRSRLGGTGNAGSVLAALSVEWGTVRSVSGRVVVASDRTANRNGRGRISGDLWETLHLEGRKNDQGSTG